MTTQKQAQRNASLFFEIFKVLCYFLFFLGVQILITILMSFFYLSREMQQNVVNGLSFEEIMGNVQNQILGNVNLIEILYASLSMLLLFLFFLIRRKHFLREIGATRFSPQYIPAILVLAVGLTCFMNTALNLLPEAWLLDYAESSSFIGNDTLLISLLSAVVCAPILEETIFRGLILSRLKRVMPTWVAVILSSLLFGLAHGQILWTAYAFVLGILFCLVVERTGSILSSLLMHALFNTVGTLISFFDFVYTNLIFWGMFTLGCVLIPIGLLLLFSKKKQQE